MTGKLVRAEGQACLQFLCPKCGKDRLVAIGGLPGTITCRNCQDPTWVQAANCFHTPCSGSYAKCGGAVRKLTGEEQAKEEAARWWEGEATGTAPGARPTDGYHEEMQEMRGAVPTYRCTSCQETYSLRQGVSHGYDHGAEQCKKLVCTVCKREVPTDKLSGPETIFNRSLAASYEYIWLDALEVRVEKSYVLIKRTLVVAVGVGKEGRREVLACLEGDKPGLDFWREVVGDLAKRGVGKVGLVVANQTEGLGEALKEVWPKTALQCDQAEFVREVGTGMAGADKAQVQASLKEVLAEEDLGRARWRLEKLAAAVIETSPKASKVIEEGEDEALACIAWPREHWGQLSSLGALKALNTRIRNQKGTSHDILERTRGIVLGFHEQWQKEGEYLKKASKKGQTGQDSGNEARLEQAVLDRSGDPDWH